MTFDKQLERVGKVAAAGWGDQVVIGILVGYLKKAKAERLTEYINENKRLLDTFSKRELKMFRRMAKTMNIDAITSEEILNTLREEAPALSTIFDFHPKGRAWLDSQIPDIKKTLS